MEGFIFIIFVGFIIFQAMKGKSKSVKPKSFKPTGSLKNQGLPDALSRLNAGKRTLQTGSATAAKYQQIRNKRRQAEMDANSGLKPSKDRQDRNRNRRTDWGTRGDSALFSPKMISIIGGGLVTVYLALTALNI